MYRCTICHFRTSSLRTYGSHYNSFHAALPNPTISCPVTDCGENLPTFPSLKSHISRQHKGEYSKQYVDSDSIQLQCEIRHCLAKYLGLKPFIARLKGHIKDGIKIACPFQQCDKRFEVVSSFSSHLSRYHKDTSVHHLHVAILSIGDHDGHDRNLENQTNENNNTGNDEEPCTEICHSDEDENNFLSDREIESALTTKLATFLLSIQTKHHLPEIIHWYEHDNLKAVHDTLRSKYYRKKYYKEKFDYVEPLPHPEPKHKKDDTKALCYYVPLKDSLQALFRDEKISHYFEKSENNGDLGVLTDFTDGKVCNENVFFQENPDALKLLLYQDSFEIVNPLGSAKKKHKILAIYYTIGNLHPAVRTLIDVQQLLLLCREEDFKTHGQEKILTPIMTDLLDLEANGVDLGRFGNRKGSVAFVLGDNLGSHMIGGFVENFSSVSHNCRYCLISKDDLEGGNIFPWDFDLRTQENYNSSVQEVCTNGLVHHSGVKFDSVLNKLQHFHVTNPGLPPCLGHDLFEGIVKEDLHLILNYLVRAEWFDYDYLNKKIQTYKFKGSDANDKPPFTLSSKTVSGHAVQVWVLLRFCHC
ncbi:uncharacterized protein LOC143231523 [Tachypleus tridentatus]|uniref:uncharacterized protein LOC143231523 n=1 Tax=Tachypleus tridentatus TaxID=6853 RepID=UPI003FD38684